MLQYNKLENNHKNNLKNYFLNETINTLNCTYDYDNLLDEDSFGAWLSYIPGWNWVKKLMVGKNVEGEAITSMKMGEKVDNLVANKNTINTLLNQQPSNSTIKDNPIYQKLLKQSADANKQAGEASGGLASFLPESVRDWMREHHDLTTGIAVGAGVLGLIYLYKKFIKNPDKPPDKQTIQYAQKLNNLQASDLSPQQLNARVL